MVMDDDGEEERLTDVGFMFEGAEASTLKHLEWTNDETRRSVYLAISSIDDTPGAVQSGHYLWPGAPALAKHLVENETTARPVSIVELGAGCALASLVALQLFADSLNCVVVTDHDPGTLERAHENRDSTLERLQEKRCDYFVEKVMSIPFLDESLTWGDESDAKKLLDVLQTTTKTADALFDWVLGSDLIYCKQVVAPLLRAASFLMKRGDGCQFLLSQSFPYDDETEDEINATTQKNGLQRTILLDTLDQDGGVRIQKFSWQ